MVNPQFIHNWDCYEYKIKLRLHCQIFCVPQPGLLQTKGCPFPMQACPHRAIRWSDSKIQDWPWWNLRPWRCGKTAPRSLQSQGLDQLKEEPKTLKVATHIASCIVVAFMQAERSYNHSTHTSGQWTWAWGGKYESLANKLSTQIFMKRLCCFFCKRNLQHHKVGSCLLISLLSTGDTGNWICRISECLTRGWWRSWLDGYWWWKTRSLGTPNYHLTSADIVGHRDE